MRHDELPVFKAAYDMMLYAFETSQRIKREYKFSLVEDLKKRMCAVMVAIYRANKSREKLNHVRAAMENMAVVKLNIRLLFDLKQITPDHMSKLQKHIDTVAKQLEAWHKALAKNRAGKRESPPDQDSAERPDKFSDPPGVE